MKKYGFILLLLILGMQIDAQEKDWSKIPRLRASQIIRV